MLVLSRREEESIIIDDTIEIKIVGIKQDQVKIGIIAPKNVKIFRKEVYEEIQAANKAAAASALPVEDLKNVLKKDKKTEGGRS
ncbi:Carbon storage regulator [Brevinematales bacterium NS]|nr:carbon storage regulator CsrA [Brevinematales bacterium]QJR22537.1 Carbon storage regulator [Brevinematales bacterium NS]